jgi:hypothetical protein
LAIQGGQFADQDGQQCGHGHDQQNLKQNVRGKGLENLRNSYGVSHGGPLLKIDPSDSHVREETREPWRTPGR